MLTHLLSHRNREQTELCSSGAEENVHLSGPSKKQSTENNNQSSHFNSISLNPLSTTNGKNVQCIISGQCFNQPHKEPPAPLYCGDLCLAEGGVHPIPRHYLFGKWRFWKFSKPFDEPCLSPVSRQQSMSANLRSVSSTATENSLSSNSSSCNAFMSLSISKLECDSPVNTCNQFNDSSGSTDSTFTLPLSYIGRYKRYCLCCIL